MRDETRTDGRGAGRRARRVHRLRRVLRRTAAGPGAGRDNWPLHIDFDTVMNLPTEAKVTVNGLRSGLVSDIRPMPIPRRSPCG